MRRGFNHGKHFLLSAASILMNFLAVFYSSIFLFSILFYSSILFYFQFYFILFWSAAVAEALGHSTYRLNDLL